MAESTLRSLKPHVHVWQDWRGGVIAALGDPVTIALRAEVHMNRTKTAALSLVPTNARRVGAQIACRVTGDGADSYSIVEIVESHLAPGDPEGSVGVVPFAIRGMTTKRSQEWWRS